MKLFDSHCHINDKVYDKDLNKVIENAKDAGVAKALIVGVDKKSSIKAVTMAQSIKGYYASVGVHPHDTKQCCPEIMQFLKNLAKNPEVCAWGETGLDFNRMYSPKKDQEKWFVKQLEIADELNLPLIFHERDSNGRFLKILKTHAKKGRRGVVHCFSGSRSEMEEYINLGYHIGITGILTIKKRGADLRRLARQIPLNRILVETDAPYLTPAPEKNRTKRNEPAFVKFVMTKLAEVKNKDLEHISSVIWQNTCSLFNISA